MELNTTTSKVAFRIQDLLTGENVDHTDMDFSTQCNMTAFKDTTTNETITYELYQDGTLQSSSMVTGQSFTFSDNSWIALQTNALQSSQTACVKVIIKDSSDAVIAYAYDSVDV